MKDIAEIAKLYEQNKVHRYLIDNLAYNIAIRHSKQDFDISEYDVQKDMGIYLNDCLRIVGASSQKEHYGKFDCTVTVKKAKKYIYTVKNPKKEDFPILLYELKTFLKKDENFKVEEIYKDLYKLSREVNASIKGYFILAAKNSLLKDKIDGRLAFIDDRFEGSMEWPAPIIWKGETIKLRPSNKRTVSSVTVMSWEVLPTASKIP